MSSNFDGKKPFPTRLFIEQLNNTDKTDTEKRQARGKLVDPFASLRQKNENEANEIIDNEINEEQYIELCKEQAVVYCTKLFTWWKTGTCTFEELTYQHELDLSILARLWENKKDTQYFEFWSKAFGGKKGKK